MDCFSLDLTIDGALADPMIVAAMRADGVDPQRLETLLRATAEDLGDAHRHRSTALQRVADAMRPACGRAKPIW